MFIVPLTPMATQLDSISGTVKNINTDNMTTPEKLDSEVKSFADYLKDSIQSVRNLEAESDRSAYELAMGRDNLEEAMMLSAKESTAVEATVQITTRVVNAYKEILQMQV